MANIYFPSCKFTAGYPESSRKIAEYINQRFDMTITGCCRTNLQSLKEEDTAVYVCNTCSAFCDESSRAGKVISLWELVADDGGFPFPDYRGEEIALQDCWRAYDKRGVQSAVRELMGKMNIKVVELPDNYEKTRFCGTSLLQAPPADYEKLAPKRFVRDVPADLFLPHGEEEKSARMRVHCAGMPTEKVACYCRACADGIDRGGKKSVHLSELLFSTVK